MTSIELLAPAKDLDCGKAAIDSGADAVYIGAPRFGAREQASNTLEDIAALVAHAHTYWAKVYVTLNTLLRDDELTPALQLARQLADLGVDGLIVQDAGLLELDLPPLPLIASTQMHNTTPEKVAFLEQVGFQRVILARELSLEEIAAIRKQTNVELEVFIHGALCVCYSGQCALSYALGGRSGNRGACAQPCRKAYTLCDAEGNVVAHRRHLLSLRDLNQTDALRDLLAAGVTSFKIEGRLKDRNYVVNVVSHYRTQLDEILKAQGLTRSSAGTSHLDLTPDVNKTFNRGYTPYFLRGRGEEPVGSIDSPKMVGESVGRVKSAGQRSFVLDGDTPLHNGDGLCFFNRRGELRGTMVNAVQGQMITPGSMEGISPGMEIFRNHAHAFLTQLAQSTPTRRLAVTFTLRDTDDGLALQAEDENGVTAEFALACEKPVAEKPEQARAANEKQLTKTGGTLFECAAVRMETAADYFLPFAFLNALRRGVLEALLAERLRRYPKATGGVKRNDAPYPEKRLTFLGNVLNRRAADFYRRHGVTEIEPAAEAGAVLRGRAVMTTKYCLKHQLGLCMKQHPATRPPEPLSLHDEEGHVLELRFDCRRCEMQVLYRK